MKNKDLQLLNPFGGQKMTCLLCGKGEHSATDPDIITDWRAVVLDGDTFYACPDEFPSHADDQVAYEQAYGRFLQAALDARAGLVAQRRARLMQAIRGPNGKLKKIKRRLN